MPRAGKKRPRGEYGNRVQIPDGTAAVSAERLRHIPPETGRGRGIVTRRESEDLLEPGGRSPRTMGLASICAEKRLRAFLYARGVLFA